MPLRDGRRSLNSIDPAAVEQIEVVRGGTAVYGFGASGGVVNIITKRPGDGDREINLDIGAKTSLTETGSDAFGWNTGITASGRKGQVDYLFNGSVLSTGASFDSDGDRRPADPTGAQGGVDDSDATNFLGKFGLESDDGSQRFEATVNFYDVAQDSDFAELATGGDPALDIKAIAQPGNINVKDPGTENRTLNLNYNNKAVFGSTALDAQLYTGELTTTFSKFPGFSQTEIASDKGGLRVTFDTPAGGANSPVSVIWGIDLSLIHI